MTHLSTNLTATACFKYETTALLIQQEMFFIHVPFLLSFPIHPKTIGNIVLLVIMDLHQIWTSLLLIIRKKQTNPSRTK